MLGGLLYALGHVGFGVWPLLFVFLVPLWRALEGAGSRGAAGGARRCAGLGLLFGAAAWAAGHLWLWRLVDVFLDGDRLLGTGLALAHGGWFAAGFAVYALAFRAMRRGGAPVAWAGGAPLLVLEWLQPQLFPVQAGAGLIHAPRLAQAAELGGPLLLSAGVVAGNGVAYASWRALRRECAPPVRAWLLVALALLAALGYGSWRIGAVAAEDRRAAPLRVGLVQADLGLLEKRQRRVRAHRAHLALTRRLLAEGPLDLVVWPETAYPHALRRPLPLDAQSIRRELPVPLLFGGTSLWEEDGRRRTANSVFLADAAGTIGSVYDKNLLIPLAESLPFGGRLPGLAARLPHRQDFRAAEATPPLRLGDHRIATPICYEAVRPAFVRRMVREARPHLLVTLANDAWFGDSQEPWIHLALARLRAIEHRLWLVRATNSGVSAVIDPAGRVRARTDLLARATLRAEVRLRESRPTLYARAGDWPGALAAAGLLHGLAGRRRRRAARRVGTMRRR